MRIRNVGRHQDSVTLMMTPMIDIVFLLLVFFMWTLMEKGFVTVEGDFNVKMPTEAPVQGPPSDLMTPPLKVRLEADSQGRLTAVKLGDARMSDEAPFEQLRRQILAIVGDDAGPGSVAGDTEVELDCDYDLRFEYAIDAITAVSGTVQDGQIVKMIDKIRFAPPRNAP